MRGNPNESCTSVLVTLRRFTMMLLTKWYTWSPLKSRSFWTRKLYYFFFYIIFYQVNRHYLRNVLFLFVFNVTLYCLAYWPPVPRIINRTQDLTVVERENRTDRKQPVLYSNLSRSETLGSAADCVKSSLTAV